MMPEKTICRVKPFELTYLFFKKKGKSVMTQRKKERKFESFEGKESGTRTNISNFNFNLFI